MDFQDWIVGQILNGPVSCRRLGATVPTDLHPGEGNFQRTLRRMNFLSINGYYKNPSVALDDSFESEVLRILKSRGKEISCAEMGNLIPRHLLQERKLLQEMEQIPRVMTTYPPNTLVPWFSLASSDEEYQRYIVTRNESHYSYQDCKDSILRILARRIQVSSQEVGNLFPPHLKPPTNLLRFVESLDEVDIEYKNHVPWFSLKRRQL